MILDQPIGGKMKEITLLDIVEAYVFDGVEVIINDGKIIGFEKVNYNN